MRYWLPQIALLAGILLFIAQLPLLGSTVTALLATLLAGGTVWTAGAALQCLRPGGAAPASHPLAQESSDA